MTNATRKTAAVAVAVLVALGATACSDSGTGSGAPPPEDLSREAAEVAALRRELAALRAEIGRQAVEVRSHIAVQGRQLADYTRLAGGLCANPCAEDTDQDGSSDCEDPCPCDPANADADADGAPDCLDPCPADATNACIDPCRADSDGDGADDCSDPCPYDPNPPVDADGDDIPDCGDACPGDPSNRCTDRCLLDQDADGSPDCNDICPWAAEKTAAVAGMCLPVRPVPRPNPAPPDPCICPEVYRPVCGADGRTYDNSCTAACAGIAVAHEGPCTPVPVDGEFCGWDTGGPCESDADCRRGGCSAQVCQSRFEDDVVTTCEFRDCYNAESFGTTCGCVGGRCRWEKQENGQRHGADQP